ncbi:MAG: hypothetical protein C0418_03900 [Coriobacteriaceae bacterium]|nr:hypothetical protein [Coriobacteriaceae bacterium]
MRKVLVFLAIGVLAASAGAAGAYFTGQAQVPENLIRAGSVAVSAEPTSAALSMEAVAPGGTQWRPLTVGNDGQLPVSVVVTNAKKAGITDFYEALQVTATVDGQVVYEGALSAMRTAPFTLAPGARAAMRFGVGLPATAGNDLAGDYAKTTLYVDAEQVR